ncbi:AT-hook motif nuclear-localized protein 28-like [Musa acuminata AAA Group]|uniref:AT-hook motif nuclear-localized protein 28 n=1 Tax=Musa acuminata AAA Group TaxID=214697 RepID=UPI0031D4AA4A
MKDKLFQHHYLQQHQQQQHQKSLSDEVDSSKSSGENKKVKFDEQRERTGGDGSTIEVVKRPRGRPPGSKNKPKVPVVITREEEPSAVMRPHVLEIPAGHDVADSLARFSQRRNLGICVLSGIGAVANVTLRQPHLGLVPQPAGAPATIVFRGRFEILSITGTFLTPAMAEVSPAAASSLSISLAGPQAQIVGGTVAGPLVAAGTVVVVAAAFSNPTFHRLPAEDDVSASVSITGGGGGGGDMEDQDQHMYNQQQKQQAHRQRRHQVLATTASAAMAVGSSGMAVYSGGHVPSDVIWAPTARPPPPPPY